MRQREDASWKHEQSGRQLITLCRAVPSPCFSSAASCFGTSRRRRSRNRDCRLRMACRTMKQAMTVQWSRRQLLRRHSTIRSDSPLSMCSRGDRSGTRSDSPSPCSVTTQQLESRVCVLGRERERESMCASDFVRDICADEYTMTVNSEQMGVILGFFNVLMNVCV